MSERGFRGSFWPSETQRALLQVALGPVEQSAARWQELQPLDLATLAPGSFPLLPLLYERLAEVAPGEPQLPRLLGTYRRTWYRNQLLLDRLDAFLPRLQERGIDPLLVGGAALVVRWYPRLGLRPVPQLELLVPSGALESAAAVAEEGGWHGVARSGLVVRLVDDGETALVLHDGAPPAVAGPLGRDGGYRTLEAHARVLREGGGEPLVLDPVDELLFVCAAGARTMLVRNCQWLLDVWHLIQPGRAPSGEALITRAHQLRLVEPLREAVAYLADVLGGERFESYSTALHAQPVRRRDRIVFRLNGTGSPRLVGPAQMLATHLQGTAGEPLLHTVTSLPRFLQESWGTPSVARVPLLTLRKAARLARPPSRLQLPAAVRNRSASS